MRDHVDGTVVDDSRRRAALGVALSCALLGAALPARAAERVRLDWVRLEGAGDCIDSALLETRVRQRLGSDPFDPRASRSVEGVVRRIDGTWRAEVAVRAHSDDTDPPIRELKSEAADCESLGDAVVLAVALAIDPAAALSGNDRMSEGARPARAPADDGGREEARTTPGPLLGLSGRLAPAAIFQIGLLPRASFGAGLIGAVAVSEYLELGLPARIFPAIREGHDPGFEIGFASGGLEACTRLPLAFMRVCGGPVLGVVHATLVSGDRAQPGERAWLAAELGIDTTLPLKRSLRVLVGVYGVVSLTRYRFVVDGAGGELFDQAPLAGIAHAGLEIELGGVRR